MKLGKVSQTVYQRSVKKQLHMEEGTALLEPRQAQRCYGIRGDQAEKMIACDVSLYGNEKDLCVFAMAQAINHLGAAGAKPAGVSITVLLPDFAYESRLKAMMRDASDAAARWRISILSADAQVIPHIDTTIVHVTAQGILDPELCIYSGKALPEQDIVQINHIGTEGALRVKREKEEILEKRFSPRFLDQIEKMNEELCSLDEMEAAAAIGVSAMHQVVDGGITAALWNLAEDSDLGLSVDMRKIAVRQEAIEVCECFHLNPYQLTSAGCVLVVTDKGEELADALDRQGMSAVVIGRTHKGNERVLLNGEEKRYLDRPAPDELTKIYGPEAQTE